MPVCLLILLNCFTSYQDYYEEILAISDQYAEGVFTITEFNSDEKIVFAATVLAKRDGHFLIHVKPTEIISPFGTVGKLMCFNPAHQYQFELERNEQDDGWNLASVETELSNPIGLLIGPTGIFRNYCIPTSAAMHDFQSLVATDGAQTSYELDELKNTVTALVDLSKVEKNTLNSVTMVFQREKENAPPMNSRLRMLNKTLVFRSGDSTVHQYEYSGESPIPTITSYYRNGQKVGYHHINFRKITRSDDAFSLSHYGFREPPRLNQRPSLITAWFNFPVLLVIFGVLICAISFMLNRRRK